MTAQDLKNSILQLAAQGKLVPQDPADEPASELLKRIKAAKERLVKEGSIKKEKPLLPISEDEIPFDIPDNWLWVRLGEISSITSGGTPSRTVSTYWNGDIPWVKISDISDKYVLSTEEKITRLGLESSSAKIFPNGTLLYTIFATIGTVGILNIDAATNQAVAGITFYGEYNIDYLYYILVGLKDLLIAKGKGMAQMNINQTVLKNTPIPLPPIAEQQRVVAKIEELMPLVEEYGKAEERLSVLNAEFLDKLRKSILQQAIQGKLTERNPADESVSELLKRIRAKKEKLIKEGKIKKEKPIPPITEEEVPFEIPENWKWVHFSDIAVFENGDRSKKYPVEADYVQFGVPFFGAKDMGDKYMSFENVRYISEKKYDELGNGKLQDKDFICLLRGSVGKSAIFSADNSHSTGFICAQMIIIRLINKDLCEYIFHYLSSPYYTRVIESKVTGTAVKQLPGKELGDILIPLPPFAEQQRIVDRVNELLARCREISK